MFSIEHPKTLNLGEKKMNKRNMGRVVLAALFIADVFYTCANAATSTGLGGVASTVTDQLGAMANLMVYVAYVSGVGFALAGILQFKAHKENPQQTPLSKPIVLVIVAACLLFLPSVMSAAGGSIFGTSASGGGATFSGTVTAQ
jgi:intracellular multiplication protein IcmD